MRIGIIGYGNLGRGVECAIRQNPDMELVGVFTRRDPKSVKILSEGVKVFRTEEAVKMKDEIDIAIICAGSATDLPEMTPYFAESFSVIDSFDNHQNIPVHFENVNKAAEKGGNIAIISVGWDPGLFSLNRVMGNALLPEGYDYTFWGKGVSQGHSNAIKDIEGVIDSRQYTIPIETAIHAVRAGENPELKPGEKHRRECFVVVEDGADSERIKREIVTMPQYFADYDTSVHFISKEELLRNHSGMAHGGNVIRTGKTGWNGENSQMIEYKLNLDSNPEFTASVLVSYARAAFRMKQRGITGCKTVFDIAPGDLSPLSPEELRKKML
ncbi:MAG: diaminopimelate dehydrogenase [Gudongella sp.]|jgi:diaminopimelate dehydrogenase|nr:diaminopimelate dehydrogenase [Gudongella sp.]